MPFFRKEKKGENKHSDLVLAIITNDLEQIRLLLQSGLDPDLEDPLGRRPLEIAAEKQRPEALILLLKAEANSSIVDKDGNSLLMQAVIQGSHQITDILLRIGLPFSVPNFKGHNSMDLGRMQGNEEYPELLLGFLQDIQTTISFKRAEAAAKYGRIGFSKKNLAPPIHDRSLEQIDSYYGNLALPELELKAQRLVKFLSDSKVFSSLPKVGTKVLPQRAEILKAIKVADLTELQSLLQNTDLEADKDSEKEPLLFFALNHYTRQVFEMLLHFGFDPDITFLGSSILLRAMLQKNLEAFCLLLDYGADPLKETKEQNALWAALEWKLSGFLLPVLNKGVDANYASPNGSVLESLILSGDPDMVDLLAKYNFEVNRWQNGKCPLSHMAESNALLMLKAFLDAGLDLERMKMPASELIPRLINSRDWDVLEVLLQQLNLKQLPEESRNTLKSADLPYRILKIIKP